MKLIGFGFVERYRSWKKGVNHHTSIMQQNQQKNKE